MSDKKHRDIVDRFGTVDNPKNELAYKIKIDNKNKNFNSRIDDFNKFLEIKKLV